MGGRHLEALFDRWLDTRVRVAVACGTARPRGSRLAHVHMRVHLSHAMTDSPPHPSLHVGQALDGTVTYFVDRLPGALPPVRGRDLAAAWEAARGAALGAMWGAARRFCFRDDDGRVTELALHDRDARCWAGAVELTTGLQTLYGLSLCLRLLALVDLLATARWARGLCDMRRDGAELHPALLRVAAEAELTNDARFDETRIRADLSVLPGPSGACA